MKHHRLFSLIFCMALFFSCAGDHEVDIKTEADIEKDDETLIRTALVELIDRVKEGDKTVLYENEFGYFTDSVSLSEYMEVRRVLEYKYDTLSGILIDSVHLMGDSAMVNVRVTYESAAGGEFERPYAFKMYRYGDRWIKPYLSRYEIELEYLERVRAYDSAVAAEENE